MFNAEFTGKAKKSSHDGTLIFASPSSGRKFAFAKHLSNAHHSRLLSLPDTARSARTGNFTLVFREILHSQLTMERTVKYNRARLNKKMWNEKNA